MKLLPLPSLERLHELLDYNAETGALVWRRATTNRVKGGANAGCRGSDGYLRIGIDGVRFKVHRIAYLMGAGVEWQGDIDHKDGDRLNNRLDNLRPVVRQTNVQNQRRANVDSRTQVLGVTKGRRGNGFRAQIGINGRNYALGTYPTPELAHEAYVKAKRELHEGCTL
jgi:hypothetical protein